MEMKKCKYCGETKEASKFLIHSTVESKNGQKTYYRSECLECYQKRRGFKYFRMNKDSEPRKDPVYKIVKSMANNARQRTHNPNNLYYYIYGDLKLKFEFEDSAELKWWLYENFHDDIQKILDNGETPSIDRVDPNYGYYKGNIRIIPLSTNSSLSRGNKKKVLLSTPSNTQILFESITDCGRYFNKSTNQIIRCIVKGERNSATPKGYTFQYYDDIQNCSVWMIPFKVNPMKF